MKKRKVNQASIGRIAFGIVILLLVSGYAQASAQKTTMVFDHPADASWIKPAVLGDEDEEDNEKEEKKEEKHEAEQRQEEQKREEENKREDTKKQTEERKETEIETQNGQKIKTKVEDDGTTKVEIEQDDLKIKYEVKNGEVNSVEEDKDEPEDELEGESELDDEELEISTEEERHTVRLNGVSASTNFPLSIDVATNELIVATKDGPKIVAVLPDRAVANLLATGIVDRVDSETELELQVQNGEPVYQIGGLKRYRFLAFIPVTQPVVSVVSAETGEVVATQQSVWANIVDFLSP